MPTRPINGAVINYQLLEPPSGSGGPAVALSPGSRNPMAEMSGLAELMAAAGYRVLLHDRRNCGASDVGFDATRSEYEMWADDLHALLADLGLGPVIMGGSSSGARLALTVARQLQRTGGRYAAVALCIGGGQGQAIILERV